jgi:hypothetical protein
MATAGEIIASPVTVEDAITVVTVEESIATSPAIVVTDTATRAPLQSIADVQTAERLPVTVAAGQLAALLAQHAAVTAQPVVAADQLPVTVVPAQFAAEALLAAAVAAQHVAAVEDQHVVAASIANRLLTA